MGECLKEGLFWLLEGKGDQLEKNHKFALPSMQEIGLNKSEMRRLFKKKETESSQPPQFAQPQVRLDEKKPKPLRRERTILIFLMFVSRISLLKKRGKVT
eukprot:TRINITY_DN6669_c0_g1_i1.p1 TRINITY_DN6669_c0_g1~~TRINITY_DN6669_c0_g1_i1.p1  ORF type:complete len:108 (-),score=31.36 TRINITY_DN6669_c0_g1_i1:222-521(-)